MATSTEAIRIEPRTSDGSERVSLEISSEVEALFRSQWLKAEAAKLVEDTRTAERLWSAVGYSAGAKIMAEATGSPSFERLDGSRNVSHLARTLAQDDRRHLILVSPNLLARAGLNIPRDDFPILVLDQKDRYEEACRRVEKEVKVILTTPPLATRWGRGVDIGPIPGISQLHCATPIFHPEYLRGWQKVLPDLEATVIHPAQGTWEEPLSERIRQQLILMNQGASAQHIFEHPTMGDLPRLPMGIQHEGSAIEVGIAKRLFADPDTFSANSGRFKNIVATVGALQKAGIDCTGPRADRALTVMAENEPLIDKMVRGSKNLSLAL